MATKNPPAAGSGEQAKVGTIVIKAKDPIRHDGKTFQPGDQLPDMSDEAAQALIDGGAAEQVIV